MKAKKVIEHLLAVMDYADDNESKLNYKFTREQCWNMMFGAVKDIPEDQEVSDLVVNNIMREFPDYMRCDFKIEDAPQNTMERAVQPTTAVGS
jgi:hypothetical protein